MITYSAEVIEAFETKPGCLRSIKVAVFRADKNTKERVGHYTRNYPNLFRTFCHFRKNEKDYALYSPDYTATRIMELPSCKDIGGEDHHSAGFCPTDYFVPRYIERQYIDLSDKAHRYRVNEPSDDNLVARTTKSTPLDEKTGQRITVEKPDYPVGPLQYYPFGFVAGCIWGDDSSWKIQFLDLEKADQGILKREERFGYVAMPDSYTLAEAIDMASYQNPPKSEWENHIIISVQKKFDLKTGKEIDLLD